MLNYFKILFNFPLYLSEKVKQKDKFILEGFAVANDFDLQNDIISDEALKRCVKDFKENGKFCLNHTKEIIGKILDCYFEKGKIWIKVEIKNPQIIKKIKSGELNCLSVKGQINYGEKVEILPDLRLRIIRDLSLEEVSLVPQGANPEAKAIRWYVSKAIGLAEKTMKKNLKKDFEELSETEEENPEDVEEENEEEEIDETEEEEDEDEDKEEGEEEETEKEKEEDEEEKKEGEKEEEGEEAEDEEKELSEPVYVEKSAYTNCMKKELKKGTPFKEAAKICSKKTKKAGKIMQFEKSAYTDCMKEELKAGTPFKEAAKKCKAKAKEEKPEEEVEKAKKKKKYPYPYPYPYAYAYPYRYPKGAKKAMNIETILESLDKVIEAAEEKTATALKKIRKQIADLKGKYPYPYPKKTELSENEKLVFQVFNSGEIELGEGTKFKKELLREGTWFHGAGKEGILEVTKETLKKLLKNFKDKVLDNVFVPLGHPVGDDPSKNTGEIVELELSKDEDKLIATIDVKEENIAEKIKKGLIKGISASFVENYLKKDSGEEIGPTLFHAALVNEPYIKGMESFVPLSEDLRDSLVIPIVNMGPPLTFAEITEKLGKIEKYIKLNEDKDTSEKTEETSETSEEEESESPEVGEKTEEGEKEETETEKKEETEEETEEGEVKEGVELAEAEKIFEALLQEGKVTPIEKDLLLPLLASKAPVELADGTKVDFRKAMTKYLKSQKPKFSLVEFGTTDDKTKKVDKEEEIPDDVKEEMNKMGLSEDVQKETWEEHIKQKKEEKKSTPF